MPSGIAVSAVAGVVDQVGEQGDAPVVTKMIVWTAAAAVGTNRLIETIRPIP